MERGIRVVRGPDWSWGNEDGGEGYVGVLQEINTANKTAIVQWDNGKQLQCRIGSLNRYDIRILDNAQIGVRHQNIFCDECKYPNTTGIRYKCLNCHDYDLCYLCYHGDKHSLLHIFKRLDTSHSLGIPLPTRANSRKCELKGIFRGAEVIRGVDWEWSNQDGGPGKLGIVTDIKDWKNKTDRSVVEVQWLCGNTMSYRLGHKGYCDVQCVVASSGGFYYPEHLPVLGQTEEQMRWNQILDVIEIQQIQQLKKIGREEIKKMDNKNKQWSMVKHSTPVQFDSIASMYASKIMEYNFQKKRSASKVNLANEFCKMVSEFRNDEVKEIWEMIKYMSQLPEIPSNYMGQIRYSKEIVDCMIKNGKKYLEDSYKSYMISLVNKNLQLSGSDLSQTYRLVHSFVGHHFQDEYVGLQDGVIDNRPLWPMVYYCIRIGDFSTAISCLDSSPLVFNDILSVLKTRLNAPDSPSLSLLEENIRFSYRTVRNETDPFKRTVWSLLGGIDELSEIIRTADDYLWFNLHICRNVVQYKILQEITLQRHEDDIYEIYETLSKPLLHFKLLILTGQFEAAIDLLYCVEAFEIESIHMAVTLNEMNILLLSEDGTAPLISVNPRDPRPSQRLNLAVLIKRYINKFNRDALNGALHYFFLLRQPTNTGRSLCKTFVSDLALSMEQYERIFGKMRDKRNRFCRLMKQFINDMQAYTSAECSIREKQYYEAFMRYTELHDMDTLLGVLYLTLAQVTKWELEIGSPKVIFHNSLIGLEKQLSRHFDQSSRANILASLAKIRSIMKFFDLYTEKKYPEALKELNTLEIVPLKFDEIHDKLDRVKSFHKDFLKVLVEILLATMMILLNQCNDIKEGNIHPEESFDYEEHLKCLWVQANCIINFATALPSEEIRNVINRLIELELLMHCESPEKIGF